MRFRFVLLLSFLFLLAGSPFASTLTMNWAGVKSFMPQNLEGPAYSTYSGKVYIFGGFLYDQEQNSAFVYDPSSDSWSAGAPLPTARYYCSAAETGGRIYVIGGAKIQSGAPLSLSIVEVFDPASNSWTTCAALPTALRGLSAVAANGKIYVLGGKTNSGYSNNVYEYDPSSNQWISFSTAPFSAAYGGTVYCSSKNKIYYMGGVIDDTPSSTSYLGKAYAMSASTGLWDASPKSMPFMTADFGAAPDSSSGLFYIVGGTFYSGEETPYPDIQVFNTASETFAASTLALMPAPLSRYGNCAAVIGGNLYLLSGAGVNGVDVYAISSDIWHEPNSPLPDEITAGAVAEAGGKLYVVDGGFFSPLVGEARAYDPASNSWSTKTAKDPLPRIYSAYGVYNDKIILAEGMDGNKNVIKTAVVYDPAADSFTLSSSQDANATILSASAVYNGKLYIFGGRTDPSNPNSLSDKTRIFDIPSSSFSAGPDLPLALEQAAAVAISEKIYIFGGATLTSPDYINKNVLTFDPAASTFQTGPAIPYPTYGSCSSAYGSMAIIDSGYYLFYSDILQDLGGGALTKLQVFDTQTGVFTAIERPYAKQSHGSTIIGTRYYSTAGDDGYWPSSRLDIADIVSSGCSFTCAASASPESGTKPLTVNFTASASGTGCSGSPSYQWTFGDSSTSSEQNPTHVYENDGAYTWSVTVTWGGQTCQKTGAVTIGGCQVTCEATVSATSGTSPLSVDFSASSTATGCASEVTYLWDFGDGATSTGQSVSHTYINAGTYSYSLTAAADTTTCTKTGTVTVSSPGDCSLTCAASAAPTSGSAPLSVNFASTATPTNCIGAPSFLWDFGDGATSTEQNPTHLFSTPGTYNWSLNVSVDDRQCSQSDSISVSSQSGPVVISVKKATLPFRLKVIGTGFDPLSVILINGLTVPITKYKSPSYLVAKKGASLKAMVPKGVTVKIKVRNPDGSESNEYSYTR